jgi:hypothetical protein
MLWFLSKILQITGLLLILCLPPILPAAAQSDSAFVEMCPDTGIVRRTPDFEPGGIILTAFDRSSIWLYNIDLDRRYPLPDTHPCGTNCRLSPDAKWITYVNAENLTYAKMRMDGTERTVIINYAADVQWWSPDTLLVWTPNKTAYLQSDNNPEREYLDVKGVTSIQPGGRWGVGLEQADDHFNRSLINLELRNLPGIAEQRLLLDEYVPYFNAAAWSPNGQWFAYVTQTVFDEQAGIAGGEIFGIQPEVGTPIQWTNLTSKYGAVRINGRTARELSWSPDGSKIAFWVIELLGSDPAANTGSATIHILDINTGAVSVYCRFSTAEHTPNPPRLVWSPDGTHLAFAGNVPGDEKGYLLLALDIETGIFTELSDGVYPALGSAEAIAWGLPPR